MSGNDACHTTRGRNRCWHQRTHPRLVLAPALEELHLFFKLPAEALLQSKDHIHSLLRPFVGVILTTHLDTSVATFQSCGIGCGEQFAFVLPGQNADVIDKPRPAEPSGDDQARRPVCGTKRRQVMVCPQFVRDGKLFGSRS